LIKLLPQNTFSPTSKALVIDYQTLQSITRRQFWKSAFKKGFEFKFESCNRLPDVCNRLPAMTLQKTLWKVMTLQNINCVIDYQKLIIDYQWEVSQKAFWKDTSLQTILKRHNGPIYMCVWLWKEKKRDILRELNCQMLSQQLLGKHLQIYWEFIQELQFVLSSLKEKNSSRIFNLYHLL